MYSVFSNLLFLVCMGPGLGLVRVGAGWCRLVRVGAGGSVRWAQGTVQPQSRGKTGPRAEVYKIYIWRTPDVTNSSTKLHFWRTDKHHLFHMVDSAVLHGAFSAMTPQGLPRHFSQTYHKYWACATTEWRGCKQRIADASRGLQMQADVSRGFQMQADASGESQMHQIKETCDSGRLF